MNKKLPLSTHLNKNPPSTLSVVDAPYNDLIKTVTTEIQSGLAVAEKSLVYARLKTYWHIGRHIRLCVEASSGELQLGERLYQRISDDLYQQHGLELSMDMIRRTIQFHKSRPVFPVDSPLTFTHYLVLDRVKDKSQRLRLERQAIKNNLSVMQIKEKISALGGQKLALGADENITLAYERGEPFIYYVKQHQDIHQSQLLTIDCGFKIEKALPKGNAHVKEGRCIVRVIKADGQYALKINRDLRQKRYTYAAVVTRVVDGDTIDACVDLGFDIWITDRFRLRGIDAFEISDPKGREAKAFVEGYLKKCPRIVIRTSKEGAYGRWLADIFALPDCDDVFHIAKDGAYLNQILLDKSLAKIYR